MVMGEWYWREVWLWRSRALPRAAQQQHRQVQRLRPVPVNKHSRYAE